MSSAPTLRVERSLLRAGADAVICLDEVGRGALAGPVTVGAVLVEPETKPAPRGVRDSKELSPRGRAALLPRILDWAPAAALGWSSAAEIDNLGLTAALGLAGRRAIAGLGRGADVVLLDGNLNWLTGSRADVNPLAVSTCDHRWHHDMADLRDHAPLTPSIGIVRTRIKADRHCAGVSSASVLAKVARDLRMVELAADVGDRYHWIQNKGYATQVHREAIRQYGPSPWHRITWQAGSGD